MPPHTYLRIDESLFEELAMQFMDAIYSLRPPLWMVQRFLRRLLELVNRELDKTPERVSAFSCCGYCRQITRNGQDECGKVCTRGTLTHRHCRCHYHQVQNIREGRGVKRGYDEYQMDRVLVSESASCHDPEHGQ